MRRHLSASIVAAVLVAAAPAPAQEADPPARVGRVAALTGAVSFHLAGAEQWQRASLNLPLTDGAALWTQPGAAATIGVTGNRVVLDAATEFDLDHLDDHSLAATQPQGETYWRLAILAPGDSATVQTPRGAVALTAPGRYQIVSGDTGHPTEITVLEGAAKVTGLPADVLIAPNQTLTITGDGAGAPFTAVLHAAIRDAFLERTLAAERAPTRRAALPQAVARMTGAEALAETGDWEDSPEYGPVWFPPAAGYVPYREGRWAFVAPWGWTWVDDAPWGFAPTHYGRWAEWRGRWCWVPGREWAPERPPAYAPALVAFVAGAAAGSWVGWVPLGPHEAYRPPYRASAGLIEALNRPTAATLPVRVSNRVGVTVVPAQAIANSVDVAHAFRPVPTLAANTVQFRPPVEPNRATMGATSAVLRQVNPHGAEEPSRPALPGPAILPGAPGHLGAAALVGGAAAGVAASVLHTPHAGLPPLRQHGALPAVVPGAGAVPPPRPPAAPEDPGVRPRHQDLLRTEPAHPEPRNQDLLRSERSRREPSRPEPRRSEPSRPEPAHVAAPRVEPPRPAHVERPEPVRPPAAHIAVRPPPPSPHQPAPPPRREQRDDRNPHRQ